MSVSKFDEIVSNVSASMAMEDMPLTISDKQMIYDCLYGKVSFDQAIESLIREFTVVYD